jgi:hypothetical protein
MKSLFRFLLYSILLVIFSTGIQAQETRAQKKQEKLDAVKKMVENQNYVFIAQMANPIGWRTIQLNYNYDVVVSKDSVDSYLPYYGRAYVAPINPTDPKETGIQFKSKNFEYNKTASKHSGWDITIIPNDVKETRRFTFNITEAGYATLSVISSNRQAISFNGYIAENTPKKKS